MNMSDEARSELSHIRELVLDIRDSHKVLEKAVRAFEKKYADEVTVNIKSWNDTTANQQKVGWLIIGLVLTALFSLVIINK